MLAWSVLLARTFMPEQYTAHSVSSILAYLRFLFAASGRHLALVLAHAGYAKHLGQTYGKEKESFNSLWAF
jgi:hypothetical protein